LALGGGGGGSGWIGSSPGTLTAGSGQSAGGWTDADFALCPGGTGVGGAGGMSGGGTGNKGGNGCLVVRLAKP
jgi:hypothetical protein